MKVSAERQRHLDFIPFGHRTSRLEQKLIYQKLKTLMIE